MSSYLIKSTVLFLVIITLTAQAQAPSYYVKKDSWDKTLWASFNLLNDLQKSGEVEASMPDFGGSNFTIMAWLKTTTGNSCIFSKVARDAERPEAQGKVPIPSRCVILVERVVDSQYQPALWNAIRC